MQLADEIRHVSPLQQYRGRSSTPKAMHLYEPKTCFDSFIAAYGMVKTLGRDRAEDVELLMVSVLRLIVC